MAENTVSLARQVNDLQLSIACTAHMYYKIKRNRRYAISYEEIIRVLNEAAMRCYDCEPFNDGDNSLKRLRRSEIDILMDMGMRIRCNIMTIPAHRANNESIAYNIEILEPFLRELRAIVGAQVV